MITATAAAAPSLRLPSYALFAAMLAAAGLPIYIHAPKFYVDTYGVTLTSLSAVLFALRALDVVQDPLLGRLAGSLRHWRTEAATIGVLILAAGMIGLFAVAPPIAPVLWFALTLTAVFSAFSFLTILFYARGVSKAADLPGNGHLMLARWRETGGLLGVCVASVAPLALGGLGVPPFAGYAVGFAILALVAGAMMRREWQGAIGDAPASGLGVVIRDPLARRLLMIALANAAPVAVSSTLFLFYVESRLAAPGWEGPLLLLFFLSAAIAAPVWSRLAERHGAKRILLIAMIVSIAAFSTALFLGAGDTTLFAIVCIASGAALGADMTLLPAIFATRMAEIAPEASDGFALWSFVSKATLAVAAIILLPTLDLAGFTAGLGNDDTALLTLTALYAGVPCLLKLVALGLLATTQFEVPV